MKKIDIDDLRGLPLPTAEQQAAFIEHVCYAHSWYKHIPLVGGGEFVVFLSEGGERFARGVSAERYRRECGHLAYAWRLMEDQPYRVDFADDIEPAPALLERSSVTLFPYCSNDMVAVEALASLYRDDLPAEHPQREALASLFSHNAETERLWEALPAELREAIVEKDVEGSPPPDDALATEYLLARDRRDSSYQALRGPEVEKIGRAIVGLLALLGGAA